MTRKISITDSATNHQWSLVMLNPKYPENSFTEQVNAYNRKLIITSICMNCLRYPKA